MTRVEPVELGLFALLWLRHSLQLNGSDPLDTICMAEVVQSEQWVPLLVVHQSMTKQSKICSYMKSTNLITKSDLALTRASGKSNGNNRIALRESNRILYN